MKAEPKVDILSLNNRLQTYGYLCRIRHSCHHNPDTAGKSKFYIGPYPEADSNFNEWYKVLPVIAEKTRAIKEKAALKHEYALALAKNSTIPESLEKTISDIRKKREKKKEAFREQLLKRRYQNNRQQTDQIMSKKKQNGIRQCDVATIIRGWAESAGLLLDSMKVKDNFAFIIKGIGSNFPVLVGESMDFPEKYIREPFKVGGERFFVEYFALCQWEAVIYALETKAGSPHDKKWIENYIRKWQKILDVNMVP